MWSRFEFGGVERLVSQGLTCDCLEVDPREWLRKYRVGAVMKSAVHYSQDADSYRAGINAISDIQEKLSGLQPDLLILFSSVAHDLPKVIEGVETIAKDVPLCGCTGSGIITDSGSDEATHSIALMGIFCSGLTITPFIYPGLSADPEKLGGRIASVIQEAAAVEEDKSLLFLFADGLTINADALYRGLQNQLDSHIDVVGGTAGNDFQQDKTYQFCNGQVMSDAVCGVLIHGPFNYHIGVTHGSTPVGLFKTISRVQGNVIYEIDNISALDILKEYIGVERVQDVGQTLNLFELGEEFPGQGYCQNILNRAIIGVDEAGGGIRLAVEIAEGAKIRITRRDMGLVLQRTREMAVNMSKELRDWQNATFFYFNCSGRGSYLFGDPEQDVNALRDVLAPGSNMIGFFTFGEFAPIKKCNYYHNYTGVLVGVEG